MPLAALQKRVRDCIEDVSQCAIEGSYSGQVQCEGRKQRTHVDELAAFFNSPLVEIAILKRGLHHVHDLLEVGQIVFLVVGEVLVVLVDHGPTADGVGDAELGSQVAVAEGDEVVALGSHILHLLGEGVELGLHLLAGVLGIKDIADIVVEAV